VDRRFRFALDRVESLVDRVSVRLGDNNGPRGGRDKECKVLLALSSGETIVLREKGANLLNTIDRASDKMKRLVKKRIDKKRNRRRYDFEPPTGTDGDEENNEFE
jgi:ribosome-associated translation inhibitor RaiA